MLESPYPTVLSGPPRASRILLPRDMQQHHGHERHEVAGGGALLLQMGQGDRFTLMQ